MAAKADVTYKCLTHTKWAADGSSHGHGQQCTSANQSMAEYIGQRKLFQQLVFLGPPSSHSLLDLPQRSLTQLLLQVPLLPRYLIERKAVLLQARMGWSL